MRTPAAAVAGAVLAVGLVLGAAAPAAADDVRDGQWMIDALHLPDAHAIAQGEGVTVGIVDTGVDADHPDLAGNIAGGTDAWSDGRDGGEDSTGHGTAIASLIAGHGHGPGNGDGILGVAPKAKILSVGALPPERVEIGYDNAVLADGIRWLVDNGADIICLAYGGGNSDAAEEDAIAYAVANDVPVVSSSANRSQGDDIVGFPGAYEDVWAVTHSDSSGRISADAVADVENWITAPGEDMNAAWRDGEYHHGTGSSDAAAVVAGVLALVKSHWPDMSRADLFERVSKTAEDKGESGWDETYGWGIVDPLKALTADVPPVDPADPPHETGDPIYQSAAPGDGSAAGPDGSAAEDSSGSGLWIGLGVAAAVIVVGLIAVFVAASRRRGRAPGNDVPPSGPPAPPPYQ